MKKTNKEIYLPDVLTNTAAENELFLTMKSFFLREIYLPLLRSLMVNIGEKPVKNLKTNSIGSLSESISAGRIAFRSGILSGNFSSSDLGEMRKLGYTYDSRIGGFRVEDLNKLPLEIQQAIGKATISNIAIGNNILTAISNITAFQDVLLAEIEKKVEPIYSKIVEDVQKKATKQIRSLTTIDVSEQLVSKSYVENYAKNLSLTIKSFTDEQILELRTFVTKQVQLGLRASEIEEFIRDRYSISYRKAKFLAGQETRLAKEQVLAEQAQRLGIIKYVWDATNDKKTRPTHKELDGKVIFYNDPPIVDPKTGRRAHAGEDYNCRCKKKRILTIK